MNVLKRTVLVILATLSLASCFDSSLPNDFLQIASAEVSANPKDLHACVVAAIRSIDGVTIDDALYDARSESVPLKTSMAKVSGEIQRRAGGKISVIIGVASKHDEPGVQAFAGFRVKAIAAAISMECRNVS